jgi:hypothetical protein
VRAESPTAVGAGVATSCARVGKPARDPASNPTRLEASNDDDESRHAAGVPARLGGRDWRLGRAARARAHDDRGQRRSCLEAEAAVRRSAASRARDHAGSLDRSPSLAPFSAAAFVEAFVCWGGLGRFVACLPGCCGGWVADRTSVLRFSVGPTSGLGRVGLSWLWAIWPFGRGRMVAAMVRPAGPIS